MTLMPEIDSLLEADHKNVSVMQKVFSDFHQGLPSLLNDAVVLYKTCCRSFGQGISNANYTDIEVANTRVIQGLLLARIGTLCAIAITELLRMRLVTPLACARLQCESLAFIKLMLNDPLLAKKWQELDTASREGVEFFRAHQQNVRSILKSYGLEFAYDHSSSSAVHSRFIGIARAFRFSKIEDGYRRTQFFRIDAQEFDTKNPFSFLVETLGFIRAQEQILSHIQDAIPEINDPLLLQTRIPQFKQAIDVLFEECLQRHPSLRAIYQRGATAAQNAQERQAAAQNNTSSSPRRQRKQQKNKKN